MIDKKQNKVKPAYFRTIYEIKIDSGDGHCYQVMIDGKVVCQCESTDLAINMASNAIAKRIAEEFAEYEERQSILS